MLRSLIDVLSEPKWVFTLVLLAGIISLGGAFTAQYAFGMQPCILCLYQRWPYAITIVMALIGLIFMRNSHIPAAAHMLVIGLVYLIGAGIAFFHVGVELKWWKGFSGCSTPDFSGMSLEEIQTAINNAPAVACDQIPWEMFGLSMAGYNVLFSGGLCVLMLIACRGTYTVTIKP